MDNGKYRYYKKFYDESEGKWKQASVTLTSKTRQAQGHAKLLLDEKIEKKLLEHDGNLLNQIKLESLTLAEVYIEYKTLRKLELKDSTYTTQSFLLDKIFKDISDKKLNKISGQYFQRYFMTSPNSLSYKKLQKTLVNLFFKYAIKVGYIENNPINNVELPKQRESLENMEKKRAKFLSKEEMKIFKKSFGTTASQVRMNCLIEFMYLTGLRIGEALALMWDNVDISTKTVIVKYTIDTHSESIKQFKLSTPKTIDSYRIISINDRCVEILTFLKKNNVLKNSRNEKFIFLNTKGNLILPKTLNCYLKKIGKIACIKHKDHETFSSHMLRHSHISLLTELGIPVKAIMERVGHKDEKTTLQIYTHVTKQMKNEIENKLNLYKL